MEMEAEVNEDLAAEIEALSYMYPDLRHSCCRESGSCRSVLRLLCVPRVAASSNSFVEVELQLSIDPASYPTSCPQIEILNSCGFCDEGKDLKRQLLAFVNSLRGEGYLFQTLEAVHQYLDDHNDGECMICADSLTGAVKAAENMALKTNCRHCFHVSCIARWAAVSLKSREATREKTDAAGAESRAVKSLEGQLAALDKELTDLEAFLADSCQQRRQAEELLNSPAETSDRSEKDSGKIGKAGKERRNEKRSDRKAKDVREGLKQEEVEMSRLAAAIQQTETKLSQLNARKLKVCGELDKERALLDSQRAENDRVKTFPCPFCRQLLSVAGLSAEQAGFATRLREELSHKQLLELDEAKVIIGTGRVSSLPPYLQEFVHEVQRRQMELKTVVVSLSLLFVYHLHIYGMFGCWRNSIQLSRNFENALKWILKHEDKPDAASVTTAIQTFRNTILVAVFVGGSAFEYAISFISSIDSDTSDRDRLRFVILSIFLFLSFLSWAAVIRFCSHLGYLVGILGYKHKPKVPVAAPKEVPASPTPEQRELFSAAFEMSTRGKVETCSAELTNSGNEDRSPIAKDNGVSMEEGLAAAGGVLEQREEGRKLQEARKMIYLMLLSFSLGFRLLFVSIPFFFYASGPEALVISTALLLLFLYNWDYFNTSRL